MKSASPPLIIKGLKQDGSKFRPSDWCERLATTQAFFDGRKRLQYHHYVKPIILDGIKCLMIEAEFQRYAPESYGFLLAFAKYNQLEIEELNSISV